MQVVISEHNFVIVFVLLLCRLYLTVKDTDEVIKMYRDKKMYNDLIRVTKQYRKQDLEETLSLCGKVCHLGVTVRGQWLG